MKIFITGATGYIGGSIAKTLIDAGHEVLGLVRNADKINAFDAIINAASSDHLRAIETFIKALAGTGKTFIHTSGSSVIGDDAQGEYESEKIYSDDAPFTPNCDGFGSQKFKSLSFIKASVLMKFFLI